MRVFLGKLLRLPAVNLGIADDNRAPASAAELRVYWRDCNKQDGDNKD
jgi:hypothetical protein